MGSNREKPNIAIAILEKVPFILFVEDVKLIDCDAATEDTTTINTLGNNIISAPKLQTV